jgi:hypothetical protein
MKGIMLMKPGIRLRSVVCDTEVIVVRAPVDEVTLECGGQPMALIERNGAGPEPAAAAVIDTDLSGGTLLGKRYVAAGSELEVLCTKAGTGTLTLGKSALTVANSKPLPSSD